MAGNPVRSLNVKVLADIKDFSSKMQNVSRTMKSVGKDMQKIGKNMSFAITAPLAAIGTAGVLAWDKQAKAIAQVDQGLKTTGGTVGKTSKELQDMAAQLQSITTFGDEEILKDATAQLLTFTNITGEQFDRTQKAALDLATRLDGDLKSSSIQLGKALNDPVANLSALSRSGIQFSKSQKETINQLVKTNRLADAQTIILNELEKQYGGSAEAAAKAGLGPFQQLSNTLGDITEQFGKIIIEALTPFIAKIKSLAESFTSLSPETKKMIVIFASVAAAIGPVLFILGKVVAFIPTLITGFGVLKAAVMAMTGPFGLIAIAIGAAIVLIIKNWDSIVSYFTEGEGAQVFFTLKAIVMTAFEAIKSAFAAVTGFIKSLWTRFGSDILSVGDSIWSFFMAQVSTAINFVGEIFEGVLTQIIGIVKIFKGIFSGNWSQVWEGIKDVFAGAVNGLLGIVGTLVGGMLNAVGSMLDTLGIDFGSTLKESGKDVEKFFDDLKIKSDGAIEAKDKIDELKNSFKGAPVKVNLESEIKDPEGGIKKQEFDQTVGGSDKVDKDKEEKERLKAQQKAFSEAIKQEEVNLTEDLQQIELDRANQKIVSDEEANAIRVQKEIESKENELSLARFYGQETLAIEREIDALLHEQRLATIEDEKAADAARLEAKKAAVQSGMDGAQNLIGALQGAGAESKALALADIAINTARGISGAIAAGAGIPFPGNIGAIATGVSAVVSGIASAHAALSKAPALAKGGLAFGPTMALVGDNARASTDPEVIAPLSKLQGMMGDGGMPGKVMLQARGNSLEGVLRRNDQRNRRNN